MHFEQLEKITGGRNILVSKNRIVKTLSIDSRKVSADEGTLFFAIKGDRHDGHHYIHELYKKGIRLFVVEQKIESIPALEGASILEVKSSIKALQKIAAFHRSQFSIPVIGITGSNGKTIIKEWLYQLLSFDKVISKSPGSYNSQVGVPLAVWQLQPQHQLGIFEAGISREKEMENLNKVIQPTIGIFTNIGSAHDEGFKSQKHKIQEKLKLFRNTDFILYCSDYKAVEEEIKKLSAPAFSWGKLPTDDVYIQRNGTSYTITYTGEQTSLNLPFTDKASIENCFHCVALMLKLGYSIEQIQKRIANLRSVNMRLELKEGINQCQLIDDTYNNDLGGLEISLQFLENQQKKIKRLILSDILESGLNENDLVKKIIELVSSNNVTHFVGIGPVINRYKNLFAFGSFYLSTQDFLDQFPLDELQQEVILVKGARSFQFEKIIHKLQRKVHGTVMEIDLDALVHNLNFFKSRLKPVTKLMVMVKAFAYGSGSIEIGNLLQYHKVDYLGVAYADEGIELRKNNIKLPIMVMNPSEESFEQLLTHNLEPEIYSLNILHSMLHYLQGKKCVVHLKLDTGMHRLGFEETDIDVLIEQLKSNPNIRVASIFSHLAGADESDHDAFSREQANRFLQWSDRISKAIGYKPDYHILNSSGILRLPEMQFDMVRLGIGLYGVDPTPYNFNELESVATLKTIISQIKKIAKGESIGYSRKGQAEEEMTLATIAIGYADGFSRAFSNGRGEVLINGQCAHVIGNVCMDMTMIDITGIDAREGDEVIVFGKGLPIGELAKKIQTIPYEILTSTSERVKRVFVTESV
ncbi:MAG TPA: bifunctional UDP-N-acetylmuramoyl-tripeptide:D-alanyl-D-alanine ligase/alanine racemase [Chryseolinea sp.]|nr:bifunctional UDP-N-acetylmuramoyl-tripeptide:D-alanyl-D-alanine ligase/alanine racemase [Chryseolinea sp.]HPH46975.1 bifunctional UDP-N-acetylmuramoyl-tripeptide:D-alanyl-D-alanine ligase/alanine racemase [Chryseolinea sp.]HPM28986.1 bifunctional UDP-N-acetylmuramoyl-tripeptide:D-alanyl-D-alanine ligase/alanine racemase [Chryseolinea sp.]